jgi:SAM-dependent methyltransferase
VHDTAEAIGGEFLKRYSRAGDVILEIGAYDVNGGIRRFAHPAAIYIGADIAVGPGVDIVTKAGESLPIASCSVDIVIATSVFEHDSFFWRTFLEMVRILKPGGVIYINAPSNGSFHRYPTDNWRFYPDAGKMLEKWAVENHHELQLIESFVAERRSDQWNDFVAIFRRPPISHFHEFLSEKFPCNNIWRVGATEILKLRNYSQDMLLIADLQKQLGQARQAIENAPFRYLAVENEKILQQRRFIEYLKRTGLDTRLATEHLNRLIAAQSGAGGASGAPAPVS